MGMTDGISANSLYIASTLTLTSGDLEDLPDLAIVASLLDESSTVLCFGLANITCVDTRLAPSIGKALEPAKSLLALHHGHKPLTSMGPYRFLSLSNRGPSRRSDGTGFVIHSSPMTSQVEVELLTFTITLLER